MKPIYKIPAYTHCPLCNSSVIKYRTCINSKCGKFGYGYMYGSVTFVFKYDDHKIHVRICSDGFWEITDGGYHKLYIRGYDTDGTLFNLNDIKTLEETVQTIILYT